MSQRHEAFHQIDKTYWKKCEDHILREKEKYWQKDGLSIVQHRIAISLLDSSDSECATSTTGSVSVMLT